MKGAIFIKEEIIFSEKLIFRAAEPGLTNYCIQENKFNETSNSTKQASSINS